MPRISKSDTYFFKKCKYQNHPDFLKYRNHCKYENHWVF